MSTTPEQEFRPFLASELNELEALERDATDAPWWFDEDENCWRLHGTWGWTPEQYGVPAQPFNKQLAKAPKHGTNYAEYWPTRQDADLLVAARNALPRMVAELKRLYPLTAECVCEDSPVSPSPACPVHGAVQALQLAIKELERIKNRLDALERWLGDRPPLEG